MENLLKVYPRAYNKVYIFFYIILALNLILFALVTINYCLSFYTLNYMEEIDPDIDLTGIKSFNFISSSNYEYSPGMSNLGKTGKIYLDCFIGECITSTIEDCTDSDGNDSTCTEYHHYENHNCSNECRKTKFYKCSKSYCDSYYGKDEGSKCFRDDDDNEVTKTNSCNADNLILNWKNLYYSRTNSTTSGLYTYLNSAVTSNETCPTGKKNCGILDEFGNKLCYPDSKTCPINFVTTNFSEISGYYNYGSTSIGDKKIYYTNLATDKQVFGGLFVDSDLMINYNDIDCKTLDTSSISDLLLHNYNKLYRNSLDFDPYDEEKSELDKRGKSYLKACIPGNGREKNITKIKELLVEFNLNTTNNGKIIRPIKVLFIVSYFISLPGYIVSIIFLLILLCSFIIQNNIESIIRFGCIGQKNKILIIILIISHIFTISGSIISLANNHYNLVEGINLKLGSNIIIALIIINYITFILNILLILFICAFIIYLFKTPELGSDSIIYNNILNKPLNSDFHSEQSEKKEFNPEDKIKGGFEE